MFRRWLHIVTLTAFLTSACGGALAVHEHLEGSHHDSQQCSICQDLIASSKVAVTTTPSVTPPADLAVIIPVVGAQHHVAVAVPSAISQRAPPLSHS